MKKTRKQADQVLKLEEMVLGLIRIVGKSNEKLKELEVRVKELEEERHTLAALLEERAYIREKLNNKEYH